MASHYQRLGVVPSASTEELRAAYRELALRLHPDRQSGATAAERSLAERRMREINDAWQTLREPSSRRCYDDTLLFHREAARPAGATRSPVTPAPTCDDDDLVDVMGDIGPVQVHLMRGLPWVALAVVFGFIFVFTAYATTNKHATTPTTAVVGVDPPVGSCLRIVTGSTPPATSVVPCSGPNDGQLIGRVSQGLDCPAGTEARRLTQSAFDLECLAHPTPTTPGR